MWITNPRQNLRLSSLRTSAQSAQIIREIEWNRYDVSCSLDTEIMFVSDVLFRVFIFENFQFTIFNFQTMSNFSMI